MAISSTKASALLTRTQKNPEISTDNPAWVADLILQATEFAQTKLVLPRYPELIQGFSKSAAGATEDLTSLASNEIVISVNGSSWETIEITLANADTGSNTAAELQTQIRASDTAGFDEVTVAFASTFYTLTSGRYGEASAINITFGEDEKHVAQAMKLSLDYGGTEESGGQEDPAMDTGIVRLVYAMYEQAGVEGMEQGSTPDGMSFTFAEMEVLAKGIFVSKQRLY